MDYSLLMCRTDAGTDRREDFERFSRRQLPFPFKEIVKQLAPNKVHHDKWHLLADHAEVGDCDDVLMPDGSGYHSFLPKSPDESGIAASQFGKNYLDSVKSFEKYMPAAINDSHPATADTLFELISLFEDDVAGEDKT